MPRSPWTEPLDAWLAAHLGVISRQQLLVLGCPRTSADRMLADGRLIVVVPGVYRSPQWPFERLQRLAVACAAVPDGAIGFTTACRLFSIRGTSFDSRIHLLTAHSSSPTLAGVFIHRCRLIDPEDIVTRPDGIRVTTPARSVFDAADMLGERRTISAIEQVLAEGLCTKREFFETTARLAHPNRPGSKTALAALKSRADLSAQMRSELEIIVLDEIRRQGVPMPETQYPMVLAGNDIEIDFAWPEFRIALEVDHPTWHDGLITSTRDKGRDRKLTVIGWAPMRLTSLDASGGLADAISDVAEVIRQRQVGRDPHAA
jgi:hypothetical protein